MKILLSIGRKRINQTVFIPPWFPFVLGHWTKEGIATIKSRRPSVGAIGLDLSELQMNVRRTCFKVPGPVPEMRCGRCRSRGPRSSRAIDQNVFLHRFLLKDGTRVLVDKMVRFITCSNIYIYTYIDVPKNVDNKYPSTSISIYTQPVWPVIVFSVCHVLPLV